MRRRLRQGRVTRGLGDQPRVLHLAAYGGPYSGSFIPMLEAVQVAAHARGWGFEAVFTPGAEGHPWYGELQEKGMRTRIGPVFGTRTATAWVRELISGHSGPQLLHTHFSYWDLPAAFAARGRPVAVVWHLHSRLSDRLAMRARNLVRFGLVAKLVDRILCVGPEIHQKALARLAPRPRTELFPNGIDTQRFSLVDPADRAAARDRLALSDDDDVLLLFAWDWETKGGPLLLDAVAELRRHGRQVIALVVGSSQEASAGAERLGLGEIVRLVPPAEDVRALYAAADVFVAASAAEGFGLAVLEALSCGTPVVASDIEGHRYVGRSLPACRLAPRRAADFADAIADEMDAPPDDRESRLSRSRTMIGNKFALDRWSERVLELYDDLLGARDSS